MLILVFLLLIGGLALIIIGVTAPTRTGAKKILLPKGENQMSKTPAGLFFANIFPFSQPVIEKLKLEAKIKNNLDAAHIKLTAAAFFNIKLILMLALAFSSSFTIGKSGPMITIIALAIGYIVPDLWLKRMVAIRKHKIARLLPETVDLLGLCVEGGLDFTSAVKWIIEKTTSNPMVEELSFVLEEIRWGKPRTQALKDMAKRLSIPEVSSFVQTLVQAERMGTPVAEAFTILSEDTRLQRFHRGERIAMQAPIKILIPLIFCILPVIAIIIGGPIFLQFTQGGLLTSFGG